MDQLKSCLAGGLSNELLNQFNNFDNHTSCLTDVCRFNYELTYPFYCYGKQYCKSEANDLFFALIYAQQQIQLETQELLK